jgi:hypothetical protein
MAHVFTRISGFGRTLLPARAPFSFQWGSNKSVEFQMEINSEWIEVQLSDSGHFLDEASDKKLEDYIGVFPSDYQGEFRVETSIYSVLWPDKVEIYAAGKKKGPHFDLVGPESSLIFIQGPIDSIEVPAVSELSVDGQTLVDEGQYEGAQWAEFEYSHEQALWRQRQHRLEIEEQVFLISAQSKVKDRELMIELANFVAQSFSLMEPRSTD